MFVLYAILSHSTNCDETLVNTSALAFYHTVKVFALVHFLILDVLLQSIIRCIKYLNFVYVTLK